MFFYCYADFDKDKFFLKNFSFEQRICKTAM